MITSAEILKATGLKSAKTLTRWANAGAIPKPHIGTHPNGRGKIAYWPDSVLKQCCRIVELQRSGHTLSSAIRTIEHERMLANIEHATCSTIGNLLKKRIRLREGQEVGLASVVHAYIMKAAENVVVEPNARSQLLSALSQASVATQCLEFLTAGYNPVCLFDSLAVEVVPDFLVSHRLAEPSARAQIVIPAKPPILSAFSGLGRNLAAPTTARPAPKVWAREGGAIVEYSIYLGGTLGFELVRDSAETIGEAPSDLTGGNDEH